MRIGIVPLALLSVSSLAFAHQTAQDRAAMEQKQKDFIKAFKAKDMTWFDKNAAADFVAIDGRGKKYNRQESMGQMKMLFSGLKVEQLDSTIQGIKPQGKDLLVKTYSVLKGTLTGTGGKSQKLVDQSTDEETWVKSGSGWKLKLDKTVSEKATLDGKAIGG